MTARRAHGSRSASVSAIPLKRLPGIETEALAGALLESAPDAIVIADGRGYIVLVNSRAESVFGYSREEMLDQPIEMLLSESLRLIHARHRAEYSRDPRTRPMGAGLSLRGRRKDGTEFPAEISLSPLQTEDGLLVTSVIRDITERLRAEEARASLSAERLAREAAEAAERRLAFLTRASALLAASLDYATTLASVADLIVPRVADWCLVDLVEGDNRVRRVVAVHRDPAKAGSAQALVNYPPDRSREGGVGRVLATGSSLLLREVTEATLQHAVAGEEHMRLVHELQVRSAMIVPMIARGHTLGAITFAAGESGRVYTPEDLALAEDLAGRAAMAVDAARLYQEAQDEIAERRRVGAALRRSEERLRALLENSTDVISIVGQDGSIQYQSPSAVQISGREPDEMVGTNALDLVHPDDLPRAREALEACASAPGDVVSVHVRVRAMDGTWRHVESLCTGLFDQPGIEGIVVNSRDVSDRRRLEEQLLQAQKMESVGRLAGGVAHDFNNLLTAIMGYAELAEAAVEPDHAAHEYLDNVQQAAGRAAGLTHQLLAFARKQIIEPKVVNLNDLIANVDRMLRRLIGEDIDLVALPGAGLAPVRVDPGQVEQALINLAVNARDAMPSGGKLTIETANVTLGEEYARQHVEVTPGDYVMLAVSDTGVGMTEEVRRHLFEPFFTTKEQGKGTGLGLATTYGIVKQSGGHIWTYSEPGRGTTFKIYLPQVRQQVDVLARPDEAVARARGHEMVLLVEDEPLVREIGAQALVAHGYQVLQAGNGDEALRVAAEYPGTIDLLVTDVVMPVMGGRELAEQLARTRPAARILYTSGYTDSTVVHHGMLDPGVTFLQKPFTPALLARKVREVLDGVRPADRA